VDSGLSTVNYYHTDHLGSSNVITDANGNQVQHCEYAPYGTLTVNTGTDVVKHKFTGKELDNTGLYFYAWRYYDPTLGRFTQPDTIVPNPNNPQDFNRYSYCNNNPINYTDPSGHWKFKNFIKRWGSTILSVAAVIASGGLAFALFAASSIMGGVQAYQQGQLGAWAAGFAVSMVLGAAMPTPNFSNPAMQVGVGALRGAAIGAISGGVASMVGGGSFTAGARQGAMGGAAGGGLSAFAQSQQFKNWKAGNGFVSNTNVKMQQPKLALDVSRSDDASRSALRQQNPGEKIDLGKIIVGGEIGGQNDSTFGWDGVYGDIKVSVSAQLNSTQPTIGSGYGATTPIDMKFFWTEQVPKGAIELINMPTPMAAVVGILEDWYWPDEISKYQDIEIVSK